jgi:glycine/D-amino acid oxidase-like deaminating enzyme
MGGGDLPPGFPVSNPTTSYWQQPPHPLAHHRTTLNLPKDTFFDYVIVGSGISGAVIAHILLTRQPGAKICMLEARTIASGASARNGGHCRPGWWLNFKKYASTMGEDEAIKFWHLEERNVQAVADFVKTEGVECDFRNVETCDTYETAGGWTDALDNARLVHEVKQRRPDFQTTIDRKILHGKDAQAYLGISNIEGTIAYTAHTLNPYRLVCHIIAMCLAKGLNLQTETPVLAIHPFHSTASNINEDARWTVETDRAVLRTHSVILATNAYTNTLLPALKATGFLKASRSQVTLIRPDPPLSTHHAFQEKSIGLNDRGSGDYYFVRSRSLRTTDDGGRGGDVVFGGGRSQSPTREMGVTDDSTINEKIATYLKASAAGAFGRDTKSGDGWTKEEECMDWTGITCYTPDTFPLVGQVPLRYSPGVASCPRKDDVGSGLYATVGMNGHGMAMAWKCAEALVEEIVSGKSPDWLPDNFRVERAWRGQQPDLGLEEEL